MGLVTILHTLDPAEAIVVRSRLEAHGVCVFLHDHHYAAVDWLMVPALGGVRVTVLAPDAIKARAILEATEPRAISAQAPRACEFAAGAVTIAFPTLVGMLLPFIRHWPRLLRSGKTR